MTAQRSAFTMSGDSFEPLEKEFPDLMKAGKLKKFVLTPATKQEAAKFLKSARPDAYSFFPDLYGLAVRHKDEQRERVTLMKKLYGPALK